MIKRIFIDNYRCFTNFEFVPKNINLLLGANGAGKSALFEVVMRLVDLVVQAYEIADVFPTVSRTRWEQRTAQRVELDVELSGQEFRYVLVVEHDLDHNRPSIREEKLTSNGKTLFAYQDGHVHLHKNDGSLGVSFPFGGTRSFLAQIEQRPETPDLLVWNDFMSSVWLIGLNVHNMQTTSIEEVDAITRNGSNFASWYRHLSQEHPEQLHPLWTSLRRALPGFRALGLSSETSGKGEKGRIGRIRDLVVHMTVSDAPYVLDFDELSAGQRALIVLYTLLEARAGVGCLLLDEPELHVGLAEIQPWLVELDERFANRGQVFLASHNPEVVDYMAASDPFMFERPDGGPARVRPAVFERESGLSASQQLARGIYDGG
jgi:predicted ATPase